MAQAYISGSAAAAAAVVGGELHVLRYSTSNVEISNVSELDLLFSDAWDVREIEFKNHGDLREKLNDVWLAERALQLLQVYLSSHNDSELATEAAMCFGELLENDYAREFVANRSFALPIPENIFANWASKPIFAEGAAESFLIELFEAQKSISTVRHEWSALSDNLFTSLAAKCMFETRAIDTGAFFKIARALKNSDPIDSALLSIYQTLHDQTNYIQIINSWTANIKSLKKRRQLVAEATYEEPDDEDFSKERGETHQKYLDVKKQQESIVEQLHKGNIEVARRYTRDLIRDQLQESEPIFAVKSLCKLAQAANMIGYHSLQLEWLQEATTIKPDDAWAHGQAGDAYLSLYRFEDAKREFELAYTFGDEQFGTSAKARLALARGELSDALKLFEHAKEKFEGHPRNGLTWAGYADVLRKLSQFDESLSVYNAAIGKFGEQSYLFLGRAHLLAEMGRLEEAISAYSYVIDRFSIEVSAFSGLAETHRQRGEYSEALKVFEKGTARLPGNMYLECAKASFYSATHNYDKALEEFGRLTSQYENELVPWLGLAEVLSAMGKNIEAVSVYTTLANQWASDNRFSNGYAKALKKAGQFGEALQQYDKAVAMFPYDAVSLTGRATLLKELGEYAAAERAYDQIIEKLPAFNAAKFGKASLYAIHGEFEKAYNLLPTREPRSRADWVAQHIKGMIALKQGRYQLAESIFSAGLKRSPFIDQRSYFASGMSLTKIRMKQFQEAASFAREGSDATSNVFLMHSYLELGDWEKAKREYAHVNDNSILPAVRKLRDGLAVRYNLLSYGKPPTDDWIAEQEALVLLQAA